MCRAVKDKPFTLPKALFSLEAGEKNTVSEHMCNGMMSLQELKNLYMYKYFKSKHGIG